MTARFFSDKALVIVFSFLAIFVAVFFKAIPMFWDMSYVSQVANHIYDTNFSSVIFPNIDNGSPPLFSLYFALLWTIFGKSLLVSHLAVIPFVILLFYQFQILLERFVEKRFHFAAFLLLAAEPAFSTQVIYSGYDIAMASLVLLGVNALLNKNVRWLVIALLALPLLSPRGFSFVIALFVIDFILNFRKPFQIRTISRFIMPYFISLLLFVSWLFYHAYITGWLIVSAENSYMVYIGDGEWIVRNLVYIFWKNIDSGRAILFIFTAMLLIKTIRISREQKNFRVLLIIIFSLIITYVGFFAGIHSLVAQRHFIPVYIFSIVLFTNLLVFVKNRLARMLVMMTLIALLSGNLWTYPERFGNAWDASLKSLPYFKLENELHDFILTNKMDPNSVGADFPMNFDRKYTHLETESFAFCDIDKKPIDQFTFVVQSNISNAFNIETSNLLSKNWILLKQFSGPIIYIKLYKNPALQKN